MALEVETVASRSGTTQEWTDSGLVLGVGEMGIDLTTGDVKIGNGTGLFATLNTIGKSRSGQTTLVAGTKVVADTAITANSKVFLTVHSVGGTPGWLQQSNRTPGTSFTILSSSNTDTSVIDYFIIG